MKAEIEAKFLNVDHDTIRKKLKSLGAKCVAPMRTMRRAMIDYPDRRLEKGPDAYVRVRDEGDKVTLTYKQFDKRSVDGAKELEVTVSDFEETVKIFEAIGLKIKSFQESKRETWELGEVEIVLDEWPWVKPYIEIEGGAESELKEVAEKLGLSWSDGVFGDIMAAYRAEYAHLTDKDTVADLEEVRFGAPLPDLFNKK